MAVVGVQTELEATLIKCRFNKDWRMAYSLLEPLLGDTTHDLYGWAKLELSMTEFCQTPRNVRLAARHVSEALLHLDRDARSYARAVVHGFVCSRYAEDTPSYKAYHCKANYLITEGGGDGYPFVGRLLAWNGYYYQDTGKLELAAQAFEGAAEFYLHNDGPFSKNDCNCQIRSALSALADVQRAMGRPLSALANLRRALDIPYPTITGDVQYLQGRMAQSEERHVEAVELLTQCVDAAIRCRDYILVTKASEAMVESMAASGQACSIAAVMRPIIRDAAYAELDPVVDRLQRLVQRMSC